MNEEEKLIPAEGPIQPLYNVEYPPYDDWEDEPEATNPAESAMIEVNSNEVIEYLRRCHRINQRRLDKGELTEAEFSAREQATIGFQIFMEAQFGFLTIEPDGHIVYPGDRIRPAD